MENASKALIIAGAILIAILLITIGIVLIRSGNDVTTTGTSQMASQNIQAFNSQFTAYEGTIKGSQVKSLLSTVRANNVTDETHQVLVKFTGSLAESKISSTKDYKAVISYATGKADDTPSKDENSVGEASKSENGYINLITISE